MTTPTDPASAARRVAVDVRRSGNALSVFVRADDMQTLLPVLDAVARGADGDRVERMALAIAAVGGSTAANGEVFVDVQKAARAAIALADAEAAELLRERDEAWMRAVDKGIARLTTVFEDGFAPRSTRS